MVVGRSPEIWFSEMDLAEDTWSEVSLGGSGMAIQFAVVGDQRTCNYLFCLQQKGQEVNDLFAVHR
jgi:hypothetical protein